MKAIRSASPFRVLLLLAALFPVSIIQANGGDADLLFVNGTVYTVDAADTVAESLAVKDGRILFVGKEEDANRYRGDGTEVVDLRGGSLLPGFIDSHTHIPGPLFTKAFDIDLVDVSTLEETLAKVEDAIKANPHKSGYTGFGYSPNLFPGDEAVKGAKKERLDAICPDKPVAIYAYDGHSAWLNSKALEAAGITRDTPNPPGGAIEKDGETGEPWGSLLDKAMELAPISAISAGEMRANLEEYQALMHGLGYTGVFAATAYGIFSRLPWEILGEMESEGALTLRIRGSAPVSSTDDLDEAVARFAALRDRHGDGMLRMNTVKMFMDGVLDTRTAYMLEPYAGAQDDFGEPLWSAEKLKEAVAKINAAGFQAHMHAIGDAAVRAFLDACEYAGERAPAGDYRNTVTHLQLVAPEDVGRFAPLSVVASVQPFWFLKEPDFWEPVEYAAIGERAENMYPMKTLFDAGAVVASASDSPVVSMPNPFYAVQAGVTRNLVDNELFDLPELADADDPEWLLAPGERVSVRDMIRSYTINAAYSIFMDKEAGTLEPGKLADLIVLDRDILAVPPLELRRVSVLRTYAKGRLVYAESTRDFGF